MSWRKAPQRRMPVWRPNAEPRTREHLTIQEVERLIEAAKANLPGGQRANLAGVGLDVMLERPDDVPLGVEQVCFGTSSSAASLRLMRWITARSVTDALRAFGISRIPQGGQVKYR